MVRHNASLLFNTLLLLTLCSFCLRVGLDRLCLLQDIAITREEHHRHFCMTDAVLQYGIALVKQMFDKERDNFIEKAIAFDSMNESSIVLHIIPRDLDIWLRAVCCDCAKRRLCELQCLVTRQKKEGREGGEVACIVSCYTLCDAV